MMRALEFLVALVIVAVLGLVAAVVMPSGGHVERAQVIGKDMRQVYDVFDNFRRFPDYAELRSSDPQVQFKLSGKAFGPGSEIDWSSTDKKIGDGTLSIASAEPSFDKIDSNTKSATIVWNLDNPWRGGDKHFTLNLQRQGNRGQLTNVIMAYDVSYGWNLVDRFSKLYIHGDPDSFIQTSLNNLQNVMAGVPNVDYSKLVPSIAQTQAAPVLLVSTSFARKDGEDGLDDATKKAVGQIQAEAKKLGVNITGPRVLFDTDYGDQTVTFDIAMPIDSSSLTVAGQSVQLVAPTAPVLSPSSAPASGSTAANPAAAATLSPGSKDQYGRVALDGNVLATLAFGGSALKGTWNGGYNGVQPTRDALKAYALTHGYKFDDVVNRFYDILVTPEVKDAGGNITTYAKYDVYLPLSGAPQQTPEQEAGIKPPSADGDAPASASTAAPAAGASAGK